MKPRACESFRRRLESVLRGRPMSGATGELAWHEHLLGCGACRGLLEAEEALEQLLASLPEPRLPQALARRVLARLTAEREGRLDRLLELDRTPPVPPGLPARVLEGTAAVRRRRHEEAQLDSLLDLVAAPVVPPDLASGVLAALAVRRRPLGQPLARGRRWLVWTAVGMAAAAGLLLLVEVAGRMGAGRGERRGGGAIALEPRSPAAPTPPPAPRTHPQGDGAGPRGEEGPVETPVPTGPDGADDPGDELLAALPILERWELFAGDELEVQIAVLDPLDEALLELGSEDGQEEEPDEEEPVEPGGKRG